jgi:hypothetical protein
MTRRMLVGPFSHASHCLDRALDPACRVRRSGSNRRQPAGHPDSDHFDEPRPVRLTIPDTVGVADTIPEAKPISDVHPASAGGDVRQGDHRRRSGWIASWIRPPGG